MENNTQLTLREILRPLMQFCVHLMGKNGREWLDAFKRFLRKEEAWIYSGKWKIWTLARMGFKKPLQELVTTITNQGFKISYSDHYPMDLFLLEKDLKFNEIEEDVYFTTVSPKELGLKPGYTHRQVVDNAVKQGLETCFSGDIIEILAQGRHSLEEGQSFWVGMEPITINTQPAMFCIAKHKEYCHFGYWNGDLKTKFTYPANCQDHRYIFRIKRKKY